MPAMKARDAIVEKRKKRRKVIGDYLNNLPNATNQCGRGLAPDSGLSVTDVVTDPLQSGTSPLPHLFCGVWEIVQIITNHLAPLLPLLYNCAPCLPGQAPMCLPAARSISVIHSLSDRF